MTTNTALAANLARDKVYVYMVLSKAGIPVPRGDYFFTKEYFRSRDYSVGKGLDDALLYAKSLATRVGYPLIVKPAHLKQSLGVSKVFRESDLSAAILKAVRIPGHTEFMVIIQEYISGPEYRLVFVKGELTICYRKLLHQVTGDGQHTIEKLLTRGQHMPLTAFQLAAIMFAGFTPDSVLPDQHSIILDDLTTIGVEPVTLGKVAPSVIDISRRACSELGLSYAGIDIRCRDIHEPTDGVTVIEVNGNPWLVDYYCSSDEAKASVQLTYGMLLQDMFREDLQVRIDRHNSPR